MATPAPAPQPDSHRAREIHRHAAITISSELTKYRRRVNSRAAKSYHAVLTSNQVEILSQAQPQSWEHLKRLQSISAETVNQHGYTVLAIIAAARSKATDLMLRRPA